MNGRTCDSANDLKYARAGGAALAAAPDVHNVDELCLQDADIQGCAPIQQLSALKEELESAQSPIMRTVFSWLFPFGPGWNSGTLLRPLGCFRRTCMCMHLVSLYRITPLSRRTDNP